MTLSDAYQGQSSASNLRLKVRGEAYQGLADINGILVFDGSSLRIDFQTSDSVLGVLRSAPKQLEVPLPSIDAVRTGAGWFWLNPWIEIEVNDFRLITQLPGAHDGIWRLRVLFRDRQTMRRFASALAFARSGDLHLRLNAGLGDPVSATVPTEPPRDPEVQRTTPRQTEG